MCPLQKYTKLGRVADTPEGHVAIQMDFVRLEKWADRNFINFNNEKYTVLHLGRSSPAVCHCSKENKWDLGLH